MDPLARESLLSAVPTSHLDFLRSLKWVHEQRVVAARDHIDHLQPDLFVTAPRSLHDRRERCVDPGERITAVPATGVSLG